MMPTNFGIFREFIINNREHSRITDSNIPEIYIILIFKINSLKILKCFGMIYDSGIFKTIFGKYLNVLFQNVLEYLLLFGYILKYFSIPKNFSIF